MAALGAGMFLTHGHAQGAALCARQPQPSGVPAQSLSLWAAFPRSPPQGHCPDLAVLSGALQSPPQRARGQQCSESFPNLSPLLSTPTGLLGLLSHPALSEPDRRAVPELGQCHHQTDLQQQLGAGEILPRSAFQPGTEQPEGSSTAHPLLWTAGESQEDLESDGRAACSPPGPPCSPGLCSQVP